MTPQEFVGLREWITTRWPAGRIWGSDDISATLYHDFSKFPAEAAHKAARDIYIDGARHAPNPSELIAEIRRLLAHSDTPVDFEQPCTEIQGGHPWAILEYGRDDDDTWRLVQCARCGEGPDWRKVKNLTELAEAREGGKR
jgi:hypothetical protein